jgi:hypothetical protein
MSSLPYLAPVSCPASFAFLLLPLLYCSLARDLASVHLFVLAMHMLLMLPFLLLLLALLLCFFDPMLF